MSNNVPNSVSNRILGQLMAIAVAAIIIFVVARNLVGFTYVQPGYVGIKVKLYGTERGVQDLPIVSGRVWYNPWTEKIYDFPTFLQYKVWTVNPNEGSPNDESITFVTKDRIQATSTCRWPISSCPTRCRSCSSNSAPPPT